MVNSYEPVTSPYSPGQRMVCATLGLASTLSMSTAATMANGPAPMPPVHTASNTFQPVVHHTPTSSTQGYGWGSQSNHTVHNAVTSLFHGLPPGKTNLVRNQSAARLMTSTLPRKIRVFLASNLANFRDLTIQVGSTRKWFRSPPN